MNNTKKKFRLALTPQIVMIILLAMLFAGSVGLVSAVEVGQIPGQSEEAGIGVIQGRPLVSGAPNPPSQGSTLFEQPPHGVTDPWYAYTSTYDPTYPIDYVVYENFWNIPREICDIHWYGLSATYYEDWSPCDPEGMIFNITFYTDAGGMPGAEVCSYENITPSIAYYGDYTGISCYYFEVSDLNPCCSLTDGWVSIQSQGSDNGCWFLWMSSAIGDGSSLQTLANGTNPQPIEHDRALTLTGQTQAPILTPIGIVALVSLLSAIAAVTIVRKRR